MAKQARVHCVGGIMRKTEGGKLRWVWWARYSDKQTDEGLRYVERESRTRNQGIADIRHIGRAVRQSVEEYERNGWGFDNDRLPYFGG